MHNIRARRLQSTHDVTPPHLSQASSSFDFEPLTEAEVRRSLPHHRPSRVHWIRCRPFYYTNTLICYCHMNVCCRSCVTWSYYVLNVTESEHYAAHVFVIYYIFAHFHPPVKLERVGKISESRFQVPGTSYRLMYMYFWRGVTPLAGRFNPFSRLV